MLLWHDHVFLSQLNNNSVKSHLRLQKDDEGWRERTREVNIQHSAKYGSWSVCVWIYNANSCDYDNSASIIMIFIFAVVAPILNIHTRKSVSSFIGSKLHARTCSLFYSLEMNWGSNQYVITENKLNMLKLCSQVIWNCCDNNKCSVFLCAENNNNGCVRNGRKHIF